VFALVLVAAFLPAIAQGAKQPDAPSAVGDDHAQKMRAGLELFTKSVAPLLEAKCVRCHGGEATRSQFDLTTREALLAGGKSGEVVKVGDASASRLVQLVRGDEKPAMPFRQEKLAAAEIDALAKWVELGAPYDRALRGAKSGDASAGAGGKAGEKKPREVSDADRDFWSFRPLAAAEPPTLPAARGGTASLGAIDRFVQAKLAERGVVAAPRASRRTLIRRASFDLLGLPPTPDDVEAFVADATPDAWPKVVDRLLASPHFGERWARHWLDLARFAESHGFEHDYDRPYAYTYRDFVIEALDRDLPFDTFVQWQIAGDELQPDEPLAWFATGFLGAGVHATQITMNQVEKERYDELDDVVATIGTSMLGLTIGCARCHDHKFDPIPTRDYYRMVAAFTKTVRSDHDVVLNVAEQREQLAAWEREQAPLVARLAQYEKSSVEPRFEEWLASGAKASDASRGASATSASWTALEPAKLASSGGATFTRQLDGSQLVTASSPRVEHDEYTFTAKLEPGALESLAELRLEALADPSLPHGGPGRADNGNFGLTEIRASWRANAAATSGSAANGSGGVPASEDGAAPPSTPLKFAAARSTFDQHGLPASAAIDGDDAVDHACWAVDPKFGEDHAAAFALANPLDTRGGGELTLTLLFHTNVFHSIGRLRVAAAPALGADLRAEATPARNAPRESQLRWFARHDAKWLELAQTVETHAAARPKPRTQKALVCSEGLPAIRLHTQGADFLEQTHFLKRGDPNQKQDVATTGFLQVLMRAPQQEQRWLETPPSDARSPWQRRSLAHWITDVDAGAGALLARVWANRVWQHAIGRGIVATPSDFGTMGAKPTHPELLEWLAGELVRQRWSTKALLREILTSDVYQEGDAPSEPSDSKADASLAADPENELFSRHAPRRLEAEAIRDAMLAVSGLLDERRFGPGVLDVADRRRSVYLFVKRSRLVPMASLFDAPNALTGVARRDTTAVAPQALFLMN
jgi:mono/diheme cytochrome c family protein